ncbi:CDCA2 protein, partial [Sapayoa aenigma]|nr:CDCA2 protein [Sapayoa aenigma]
LGGDWGTEALAVNSKGSFPSSTSGPLGDGSYLTPQKPRGEGKAAFGILEEWRKKPVDFAAVTIAESGIAQGSFTPGWNSPAALKFRRRATVGLRGSPENNSLIRYLAQQRSTR